VNYSSITETIQHRGNVWAHDKHVAQTYKPQSFISFGDNCLTTNTYSPASNSYSVCTFTLFCSKCEPLALTHAFIWQHRCLMTRVEDRLIQPLPFFNYVFSQFINSLNLLFVHTFLHQSLYFVRKHFKQRFALFFTFWQGFDQTHSSMLNSYYGNVYWHYNPIINTTIFKYL